MMLKLIVYFIFVFLLCILIKTDSIHNQDSVIDFIGRRTSDRCSGLSDMTPEYKKDRIANRKKRSLKVSKV